jgi:thiosulfate dehydrogenase [quinone] large subunit
MTKPLPYLLLRLLVGMSLFGHGLVRMPKLEAFSNWMTGQFKDSLLPKALVTPFSYILPFAELITGALLLAGLFTRWALVSGCVIMLTLIFGSSLIEEWGSIPSQLLHGVILALLLQHIEANNYSIDRKIT